MAESMNAHAGDAASGHRDPISGARFLESSGAAGAAAWWWLETEISEPWRPALLDGDREVVTRGELAATVQSAARFLRHQGVERGDRLALAMSPGATQAVGLLAGMAAAAVAPLPHTTPSGYVAENLRRLRVTKVVVDDDAPGAVAEAADALGLPLIRWTPSGSPSNPLREATPRPAPDDLALLIQSSGTTARPKVVPLVHANLLAGARAIVDVVRLTSQDRTLAAMPLYHIHGIVATLLAPLLAGGSVICCRDRSADALFSQLRSLQPTWLSASPPLLLSLCDAAERAGELTPHHHLRFLRSVTMPLAPAARARIGAIFRVPVLEVYGMTEAASQVCSSGLPGCGVEHRPGSVGPAAGPRVSVLGPDGEHCASGMVGEVVIAGASVTRGYEDVEQGGWIHDARGEPWFPTGDEGFLDDGGRLTLCGRIKEMINRGGMKVNPLRVDEAITQHPAVAEAIAFAVPHPTLGEDLLAAVVLRAGAAADEGQLRDHLIRMLPDHEVPSSVVLVEALPRGTGGKPQRLGMADFFADRIRAQPRPARGGLEQLVAKAFSEVLRRADMGRDDNFFLLGGDSLSSAGVVLRLEQALGLELGPTLLFAHPTVRSLASRLEGLLAEANAESHRVERIPPADPLPAIGPPGTGTFPASFGQSRLWFLHQSGPGSSAYHLIALWRLRGKLDREALGRALAALVERHPTLRTSFRLREGSLLQILHPPATVPLEQEALGDRDLDQAIEDWLRREQSTPFDLESGLLIRGRLLRIGPEDHRLLLNHHHIASDGWSRNVLAEDLVALYNAARVGAPSPLPPPSLHYHDHAVWHRQRLQGRRLEELLDYWTGELGGLEPILLADDEPAPSVAHQGGGSVSFPIEPALLLPFEDLCRSEGATLHMGLLAAVALVLHRRNQQDDFAIGVPVWGRNHPGLDRLIGFFVNTLPIRVRFERGMSFRRLLARVRDASIGAYEHQDLPFEQIVRATRTEHDGGGRPLVQVMLQVIGTPVSALSGMHGIEAERLPVRPVDARFDLEFFLRRDGEGGLEGELIFDTARFQTAGMERLVAQLHTLLNASTQDPDAPVASLDLLPPPQLALIEAWQDGGCTASTGRAVDELVERQAERSPDAVALLFGDEPVTYRDLVTRADRLAHRLVALGVGPDVLVAVHLDRSVELLVSVLAILKAGGAYLPLDPTLPELRRQSLLHASGATVVVTDREAATLGATSEMRLVAPTVADADEAPDPIRGRSRPDSLAYVLYTSGSTGQPKGVAMPHRALVNLLGWQASSAPGAASTLQFASPGFDVSFQEIFSTWSSGGRLVLVPDDVRRDPSALLAAIEHHRIERVFLPVVMLERLALAAVTSRRFPGTLRAVFVAGEPLRITPEIRQFFARLSGCRLWNHYGPTETHVVTAFPLPPDPADWPDHPPIGTPIANTQVYVLDREMRPLPQGVPGDVWIGGVAVARGYWRSDALTAERFVADPLTQASDAKRYRTGDRARWRADGQLEFLGRIDHQVKIRGHRVELGEVEAVLAGHPAVQATAVIVREDPGTSRSILAFVVLGPEMPSRPGELRTWLRDRLPEPAVPARVLIVRALPVNVNGKVDRKALERLAGTRDGIDGPADPARERPAVDHADDRAEGPVPVTLLEAGIVRIWQRLFERDEIDRTADFFDLGGDSLMAVQLVLELERLLGHPVPVARLFNAPTIERLVQTLTDESWIPTWTSLVSLQPEGSRPPLFLVHGWGGDLFHLTRFARTLSSDQPVYGVCASGGSGRTLPPPTVEEMSAHYADEIMALQPEGPYSLGGYSLGGMFAYAVATELRNRGADVRVLLFDTYPYGRFPWPAAGAKHLIDALRRLYALERYLLHLSRLLPAIVPHHLRQMTSRRVHEWPRYISTRKRVRDRIARLTGPWKDARAAVRPAGRAPDTESTEPFVVAMTRHSSRAIRAQVEMLQCPCPARFVAPLLARSQSLFWRLLVRGPMSRHRLSCRHDALFDAENLPEVIRIVNSVLAAWHEAPSTEGESRPGQRSSEGPGANSP